ncbi:MAG: DUF4401 domain-containing protein [Myxococcales bacterium]|nr:MAG: DUF4401 domain-containing protein [Myxococcales bacterium]
MNTPTVGQVLGQLRAEGIAVDDARAIEALAPRPGDAQAAPLPWYVRLLMGLGAWAATGFFLGFVALLRVFDSLSSLLVFGALLVAAATALRRRTRHDALVQLSLSLCLAGRCMVYASLSERGSHTAAALTAIALEGGLVVLYPDPVNRFLSTGGVGLGVLALLYALGAPVEVIAAGVVALAALTALAWEHLGALTAGRRGEIHLPVATGLATTLLGAVLWRPWQGRYRHHDPDLDLGLGLTGPGASASWGVALGLTLVLAWFVRRTLREHRVPGAWRWVAAAGLFGLLTASTPALVASALVMGLALHRRNLALLGLAIATLAIAVVQFYYRLELTLLAKAGVLVASGVLSLITRVPVEAARRRLER